MKRIRTSVGVTHSLKGFRPTLDASIRKYLPRAYLEFPHYKSKEAAQQSGRAAVDVAVAVRQTLIQVEAAQMAAANFFGAADAAHAVAGSGGATGAAVGASESESANAAVEGGLMLLAELAAELLPQAAAPPAPPQQRLQLREVDGHAELSQPIENLLLDGRLQPHVVERPPPPADAQCGQEPTWQFKDSAAIDGVFSSTLLETLRAALGQLTFDDPEITVCAARGERARLSALITAGKKHTPQRCTLSISGGAPSAAISGTPEGAVLRARYNFQLQGARESDLRCGPMPQPFAEAGAALLSAFEHLVDVGQEALTSVQINKCVHGSRNDYHQVLPPCSERRLPARTRMSARVCACA